MIYEKPELGAEAKCDLCEDQGRGAIFVAIIGWVAGLMIGFMLGVAIV